MSRVTNTGLSELSDRSETYLDLWKYFEDHGDSNKGRMITVVTWILGLAYAIAAYVVTEHMENAEDIGVVKRHEILFSSISILISVFAAYMVIFFARHASDNFEKATAFALMLPDDIRTRLDARKSRFHIGGHFGQQRPRCSPFALLFKTYVGNIFPVYFVLAILPVIFFLVTYFLFSDGLLAMTECAGSDSVGAMDRSR